MHMAHADELVLAGSRPTTASPIDALHARTCTVLIVDSIVIFIMVNSLLGPAIAAVPTIIGLFIWSSYKSKADWAYWFAPILISFVSLMFAIILFLNVYWILTGLGGSILIAILIGWATISGIRFIRIHFHPVYRLGYSGNIFNDNVKLPENEILAACPTCLAVLAVNPMLLSLDDKCPECENPLVLNSVSEEE